MTARVCPVHGEYAADGVCCCCEPDETPAQELARINAGVSGESPGARALRDVKRVAEMLGDPHPRWDPAPTYMGAPVVLDPNSDRDGPVLVSWTLIEKTDEAYGWRLEWTAPVPPGPELNADKERRLAEEHAALRWERVARRWATKHPSPWVKLDRSDVITEKFEKLLVDSFLRWFYGLEPKP